MATDDKEMKKGMVHCTYLGKHAITVIDYIETHEKAFERSETWKVLARKRPEKSSKQLKRKTGKIMAG